MKATKVYIYDLHLDIDRTYSITNKLYLVAGTLNETYITVGANKVDTTKTGNANVNNGLKISLTNATGTNQSPYITGNINPWLRTHDVSNARKALQAKTGNSITSDSLPEQLHNRCYTTHSSFGTRFFICPFCIDSRIKHRCGNSK
ncbi:MAG: hypothetical protein ACI4PK_02380 [Oscillospiraceae bacterium]